MTNSQHNLDKTIDIVCLSFETCQGISQSSEVSESFDSLHVTILWIKKWLENLTHLKETQLMNTLVGDKNNINLQLILIIHYLLFPQS